MKPVRCIWTQGVDSISGDILEIFAVLPSLEGL